MKLKEIKILSTSNELRVKKSLLAVRQFLNINLDVPLNVKPEWSAQLVKDKLSQFRESKEPVIIPNKASIADTKHRYSKVHMKND
jgi:hypothetical protein